MTPWILIVFFHYGYSGGATSIEFSSSTACEVARDNLRYEWKENGWGSDNALVMCAKK
jgi:hypothetical protein